MKNYTLRYPLYLFGAILYRTNKRIATIFTYVSTYIGAFALYCVAKNTPINNFQEFIMEELRRGARRRVELEGFAPTGPVFVVTQAPKTAPAGAPTMPPADGMN